MEIMSLIHTEWKKQKRSLLWAFILIIPMGTTGAMFLDMNMRYEDYLYPQAVDKGLNSWELLLLENHQILGWGLFVPIFVAIIAAFIHYTEFRDNSWKQYLSFSIYKSNVLLAKFIVTTIFSFLMITLNTAGLILVGKIIGFPEPIEITMFSSYVITQFVAILAVAALHNWISSYFKNIVIAGLIAFIGLIVSTMLMFQAPHFIFYFPYATALFADGLQGHNQIDAIVGGVVGCVVFSIIGIIEFTKRDIM
ncbi:hypothetical protein EJF36_07855 [Bacillus sp. HMF5848]|uniref:ABC transporter permease n=1 Tax=Bacillus sp. HMF5848 TaxID=2495421 RepID=UPI000F79B272|nr:ABC transporter permease [Bacillus sp. HMF5848]RSK26783.1 hypothetical protein EJF36_07855 [Bacillus sp. HMF5848]